MNKMMKTRRILMKHDKINKKTNNKINKKTNPRKNNKTNKKTNNKTNKKKFGGTMEIQNAFMNSTFEKLKTMKNMVELHQNMPQLCKEFNENIILTEKYEFTPNICSYIVTSLLLPFLIRYEIYPLFEAPYEKFDILNHYILTQNTYSGKELKEYDLTKFTPFPDKSLELLSSCKDDHEYCIMSSKYLIIDSSQHVKYLCNEESGDKIKRIELKEQLPDQGYYSYCILPSGLLCLFEGNHSIGSCGQPVICAGNITVLGKEIIQIDNSSGHYSPPSHMLIEAIELLKSKGIITSQERLNKIKSSGEIKVFVFDLHP